MRRVGVADLFKIIHTTWMAPATSRSYKGLNNLFGNLKGVNRLAWRVY